MSTATETTTPNNGNDKKPSLGAQQKALITRMQDRRAATPSRVKSMGDLIKLSASSNGIFESMPRHITPERIVDVFLSCFRANPKLLDCTLESVMNSLRQAATSGFEVGGVMGHAYLVPYKNECVLIPGYKGLIDLCRRTGEISTVFAEVVREGDYFDYQLGDDPFIKHRPLMDEDPDKRAITHVYAVFRLKDGGVQRRVRSRGQIDTHKKKFSQAWKRAEDNRKRDSPWHTDWEAMAKKTVLRGMIGSGEVPVSAVIRDLVSNDMIIEGTVISSSDATRQQQKQVSGLLSLTQEMEDDLHADDNTWDQPQSTGKPHVMPEDRPQMGSDAPVNETPEDNDRACMLDALRVELSEATTIKACQGIGQQYIAQYAKQAEDQDLIVQHVAQRQTAIRAERKGGDEETETDT